MGSAGSDQRKASASDATTARPRRGGLFRFSVAQFLIALLLLIAASPFLNLIEHGGLVESMLWTFVMVSAAVFVGVRRGLLLLSVCLVIPVVISRWLHNFRPDLFPGGVSVLAGLLFTGFVVVQMVLFILSAGAVDSKTLCAAVATPLTVGMLWGFAYTLISFCGGSSAPTSEHL